MHLSNHISKLLFDHDCVTVPGFGSFLGNYKSAQYDFKEQKFYPPSKQISFNSQIKDNDGLLAKEISKTLDLSYEYADHERFIDRGIPTIDGSPDESLADVVFGDLSTNIQTLEASIMRAQVTHTLSDTSKANFSMTSSSFEKMYQNLYASGYDGTLVTMDGYRDPTERDNFILSGGPRRAHWKEKGSHERHVLHGWHDTMFPMGIHARQV